MSTTENSYPVRNVPSILYTNPPNTSDPVKTQTPPPIDNVLPADIMDRTPVTLYESSSILSNKSSFILPTQRPTTSKKSSETLPKKSTKDTDDYIFQMYIGSLSVVGLFVLFRLIQKS
jgi:hypothetical protein